MFDRIISLTRWTRQIAKALRLCGKRVNWLAMAAALLFLGTRTGRSPTASETEVKAAFIYNFAKFVEWPADAFSSDTAPI